MKKKPVAKPPPPSAVVTPAKPEKPAEGIPEPGPKPVTTRRLLDFFENLALRLEKFFDDHPETLDEKPINQIHVAMTACHNILAKKAAQGSDLAFNSLALQTCGGCKTLHDLTCALDGAVAVAGKFPEWPVLVSPQKKSLTDAGVYVRRIGVGTASNPPTATMNAALEMRWRNCASGLIDKILEYRDYLTNVPQSHVWQELRLRPENLPKAENWKKLILKLPPRDKTKATCDRWWAVAKHMLDVTPLIDDQIKRKVKDDLRTPEKYAEREVKRAFYKLF